MATVSEYFNQKRCYWAEIKHDFSLPGGTFVISANKWQLIPDHGKAVREIIKIIVNDYPGLSP
ncbi:MAG: hypothetical protein K9H84_01465 [Bacteroidales bacterium]|nr:hypothetical protein [Bacteroidales bacterium]